MYIYSYEAHNHRSAAYDGSKEIGFAGYQVDGDTWIMDHTEVNSEYKGQGVAAKMVDLVVEEAEKNGKKINPVCSYVLDRFQKNPEKYSKVWVSVK